MMFGWPDLYGVGDYCLMANRPNDANPVIINDYFRADQGWINVVDVDRNTNAYYRAAANSAVAYRFVNPARPQECFFWSNLKNEGRRAVLKGGGLLVLHFDKDIGVNDPPNPLSLAVVQADGKEGARHGQMAGSRSDPMDYFTQETGPSFGPGSNPAAKWNNGAASGLNLYGIGPGADTIGFHVGSDVATALIRTPAVAGKASSSGPWFDLKGARALDPHAGIRSPDGHLYGKTVDR